MTQRIASIRPIHPIRAIGPIPLIRPIRHKALAMTFSELSSAAAASPRPNIVLIMSDQQSADAMSCRIGGRHLKTPNMDSLAATGMVFTRAHVANPLCVPSRASMFTGRHPVETGVQTNSLDPLDPRRFPCMGTIFQQAGYATAYFGKWHLPYPERDSAAHGFSVMHPPPKRHDEIVAQSAAEFIRTNRRRPFLLVASFVDPHDICQWSRGEPMRHGEIGPPPPLDQCPPPRPNLALPKNETDIMSLMRRSYQSHRLFPVSGFDEKKWREYEWAYYRLIELADRRVGQVLQALRDSGLEDDTLVVFVSDHGDCQGSHKWNQKTVFYDEAVRVPLIISYKGVTKPGLSDRLAHTGVDLIPTLCDYAGIPVPAGLPGLSLKDTANSGNIEDSPDYIIASSRMVQSAPVDGRTPTPDGRMVRSRRYKYFVYSEGERRETLFDLESDPGEMANIAEDPGCRDVLNQHREFLKQWCRRFGDPFPHPVTSSTAAKTR